MRPSGNDQVDEARRRGDGQGEPLLAGVVAQLQVVHDEAAAASGDGGGDGLASAHVGADVDDDQPPRGDDHALEVRRHGRTLVGREAHVDDRVVGNGLNNASNIVDALVVEPAATYQRVLPEVTHGARSKPRVPLTPCSTATSPR